MFGRFSAVILGFGLALTGAVQAAEVKRSIEIKGEVGEIWSKIGGWCAIAEWHPAVAKCEESDAGGQKSRTLTTVDGAVIKETMLTGDETGYGYRIAESPLPVANYKATFAAQASDSAVNVIWSATFDPKGASEADAVKVIEGIFDGGLEGIRKTFE